MKKKILVVDDDPGVLEALSEMLAFGNYEVKAITRGETVFQEIDDFHPDLILLDVMLSGMDGRTICRSIKAGSDTGNIPVILISANLGAYAALFDKGAPNDFIPKPFDMGYLLGKIKRQLAA